MPSKGVRLRVWCEDRSQETFIRALFGERFGIDRRSMDVGLAPAGKGSGAQWIIESYSEVEDQARRTQNQTKLGFLVVIDGDNEGQSRRLERLCGRPDRRKPSDRIAVWVPTWSIETWVLWLGNATVDGHPVDESRSYKDEIGTAKDFKGRVTAAVARWESVRADEPKSVPALTAARREFERLPLV